MQDALEILDPLERARLGIDKVQETDLPATIKDWISGLDSTENFRLIPQKSREDGVLEEYPPVEGRIIEACELGRKYGPGKYRFKIFYRPTKWTADRQGLKEAPPSDWFELAESGYAQMHKDYIEAERIKRLDRKRQEREEREAVEGRDPFAAFDRMIDRFAPVLAAVGGPLLARLLAPPPPPPSTDSAIFGTMLTIMNENNKRSEEAGRRQMEMLQAQSQENTRTIIALLTKNDSASQVTERMFGMVDKMLDLKTKVEKFNGAPGFTPASEMHDEEEESGMDWKALLSTLGTMLIPKLGMLSLAPMNMQQNMVATEIEKNPEAMQMLENIRTREESRLTSVRAFVKEWGVEKGKHVLDLGMIPYTQAEIEEAEALARAGVDPIASGVAHA